VRRREGRSERGGEGREGRGREGREVDTPKILPGSLPMLPGLRPWPHC